MTSTLLFRQAHISGVLPLSSVSLKNLWTSTQLRRFCRSRCNCCTLPRRAASWRRELVWKLRVIWPMQQNNSRCVWLSIRSLRNELISFSPREIAASRFVGLQWIRTPRKSKLTWSQMPCRKLDTRRALVSFILPRAIAWRETCKKHIGMSLSINMLGYLSAYIICSD